MNLAVYGLGLTAAVVVLALLGFAWLLAVLLARARRALADLKGQLSGEFDRGHAAGMERMLGELNERVEGETQKRIAQWKLKEEPRVRKDAIKKSIEVVQGKVAEHLVPFSTNWEFNPRDARFLGSPIDFIVFEGLTEGEVKHIWLIEVKSGKWGRPTQRQKQVQACCELGEVDFLLIHAKGEQ